MRISEKCILLTVLVITMNSIAMTAFLKNKNRTTDSTLLSFLAFSDGRTAFCITIGDILPYISYHELKQVQVQRILSNVYHMPFYRPQKLHFT